MTPQQLLADARRRAWQMRSARTDAMRLALARRICFDLVAAMKASAATAARKES